MATHSELVAGILSDRIEALAGPPDEAHSIDLDACWDTKFCGQVVLPLAFLYCRAVPGNRWHGHPVLLEAVERAGRRLADEIAPDRDWVWMRRTGYPLIHAFGLMRDRLAAPEAWEDTIVRLLRDLFFPEVREREMLTRFSSANVGYGTNHLAIELSMLCAFVSVFREETIRSVAMPDCEDPIGYLKEYLARFMAYMDPAGYWPETDGPANLYNTLTANSLLCCAMDLGEVDTYRSHFEGAAHFHTRYVFPNLASAGVTDGRNRQGRGGIQRGAFLGFLPEGRALLRLARERTAASKGRHRLSGEALSSLLTDITAEPHFVAGQASLCWDAEQFTDTIRDDFAMVKRGPWMASLSNFRFRPRPEAHFTLDYQNLFSLYHRRFGTVLCGNNSKSDPELATFSKRFRSFDGYPVDEPMIQYVPDRGSFDIREDGFTLLREYRGFEGVVELRIRSDRRAELILRANARLSEYPITCSLQPACGFKDGHGNRVAIEEELLCLSGTDLGGAITLQPETQPDVTSADAGHPIRLAIPHEAELVWPFKGWDCYNLETDRHEKPQGWTCVLRIPVPRDGARVLVESVDS